MGGGTTDQSMGLGSIQDDECFMASLFNIRYHKAKRMSMSISRDSECPWVRLFPAFMLRKCASVQGYCLGIHARQRR